jgi:hypothetical protein
MSPGSLQTTTATRLDNVHNWYLNFGLSFGLFALFLYLLIILRTFVSIARLKEVALQNGGIAGASTTFLAFFLDGLVSIEQPGLGIWLFLLAGVVVSAEKEFYKSSPNNNLAIRFMSNRRANLLKIILVLNSIVLLINTSMITYRIWNDAQLRSRIQAVLVGQVTNTNLTQIASYSINLRSEPEYAVKAFDPLANLGQIQKIEQISARVYEYNPESIQASLIQAKVLEVLNRDSEGCSIRRRLIRNSPWDKEQLLNYLICISKGSEDTDYKQVLRTSENFLEPLKFDESIGDKGVDELISMLLSATLHQRVYTLLNEQPRAELAKGEASKLINNIQERLTNKEVPDPTSARQYSKLLELLNSADASK